MYAVELFFNEEADQYVRSIWAKLSLQGIDSSMTDIKELSPHVTLGVYDAIDEKDFAERFRALKGEFKPIASRFDILGAFPVTGTCLLKPTVTRELINLHSGFHEEFIGFKAAARAYYLPGQWNPHCTLAIRLTPEKLGEVFNFCLTIFKPFEVILCDIALVKVDFEGEKCTGSIRMD